MKVPVQNMFKFVYNYKVTPPAPPFNFSDDELQKNYIVDKYGNEFVPYFLINMLTCSLKFVTNERQL
jgi:hypothetical protein